jgi:hypothetical protein
MRKRIYYNSKNIFPNIEISSKLEAYKQFENCTNPPLSDENYIYIPQLGFKILILDKLDLNLVKTLELTNFKNFLPYEKDDGLTLIPHQNYLFIQDYFNLYMYDIETDDFQHVLKQSDIFVINNSLVYDNFITLYSISKINKLNYFNFIDKKITNRISNDSVIMNICSDQLKLFYSDNKTLFCYDIQGENAIWSTDIAHFGDHYDEIWETENKGYISSSVLIIDDQIITAVEQGKIISLNCNDGKVNWIISLGEDENTPQIRYCEGDKYFYVLSNHIYEIDFHSGTIINSNYIQKDLNEINLATGQFGISKSNLYIGTTRRREPCLLILDKKTLKIINKYPLPSYCDLYGFPAVMGKHLAILDQAKNVLFFKETE